MIQVLGIAIGIYICSLSINPINPAGLTMGGTLLLLSVFLLSSELRRPR